MEESGQFGVAEVVATEFEVARGLLEVVQGIGLLRLSCRLKRFHPGSDALTGTLLCFDAREDVDAEGAIRA